MLDDRSGTNVIPQRTAVRQIGMIEIPVLHATHAEALHQSPASGVGGHGDCDDARYVQIPPRPIHARLRCLAGIAPSHASRASRQPISTSPSMSGLAGKRPRKPMNATPDLRSTRPEAIADVRHVRGHALADCRCIGERRWWAKIPHHLCILPDRVKRYDVRVTPRPQDQTLSFRDACVSHAATARRARRGRSARPSSPRA